MKKLTKILSVIGISLVVLLTGCSNHEQKQKVSNISENDIDVIGLYKNELATCIEIFFIRNSKMIGREHYFLNDLQEEKIEDILSIFIKQYYMKKLDIPNKIMIQQEISDSENISKMLNMAFNKNIEFKIPKKGESRHESLTLGQFVCRHGRVTTDSN